MVFRGEVDVVCKATMSQLGTLQGQKVGRTNLAAAAADAALRKLQAVKPPPQQAAAYRRFLASLRTEMVDLGRGRTAAGAAASRRANAEARALRLNRCLQPRF